MAAKVFSNLLMGGQAPCAKIVRCHIKSISAPDRGHPQPQINIQTSASKHGTPGPTKIPLYQYKNRKEAVNLLKLAQTDTIQELESVSIVSPDGNKLADLLVKADSTDDDILGKWNPIVNDQGSAGVGTQTKGYQWHGK